MRISLLEEREDFNQIFCETIQNYWFNKYKQMVSIKMVAPKKESSEILYAHRYFNFIAKRDTPSKAFEALKNEYSYNSSIIKRQLLKTYFNCSIHPSSISFFAHQKYYVSPFIPEKEPFIFYGGNTRLRIVYPNKNQTVVLLKNGFDKTYIENEIRFRSKVNLKISPKWYSGDLENEYFIEAYTPGTPINRLASIAQQKRIIQEAMKNLLEEVVVPTIKTRSIQNYAKEILSLIQEYSTKIKDQLIINQINELTEELSGRLQLFSDDFKIAYSHGDFQEANILLTKEGIKIIDWETIDNRSITYDFFTIYLRARGGMNKENLWNDSDELYKQTINFFKESLGVNLIKDRQKYLTLFILEELVYQLKSSCSTNFIKNGIGLNKKLPLLKNKMKEFFE